MGKATLVIMAAGIGSRFGGGIKQLEPVGPNGEIIMDYSIYDAIKAGFDKVVFVIRKDLEKDFKEVIGDRISKVVDVAYAYQELSDIPEKYQGLLKERKKPWGTGQAILCCKEVVNEPFLVINADDYYGREAYEEAFSYLTAEEGEREKLSLSMVGFVLENTLSENGGVTRGICTVGSDGILHNITETHNIEKRGEKAVVCEEGSERTVDLKSLVSMNMWGLHPDFFDVLEKGFEEFLSSLTAEDVKAEYLLPTIIGGLLREGKADVTVLSSNDKWFGVTYKEDKETVVSSVRALVDSGMYPEKLYPFGHPVLHA